MSIENFKHQLYAKELRSYGEPSLFREILEQLSGTLVRLERENTRGVNYDLRGSDNVSYTDSHKPNGISRSPVTLNRLVSSKTSPVDTPLYPSTFKRGLPRSEDLLKAVAECYIEGVSTRGIGNKNHQKLEILGICYSVCVFHTRLENIGIILQI